MWIALTRALFDVNLELLRRLRQVPGGPVVHHVFLQTGRHAQRNMRWARKADRCSRHGHAVLWNVHSGDQSGGHPARRYLTDHGPNSTREIHPRIFQSPEQVKEGHGIIMADNQGPYYLVHNIKPFLEGKVLLTDLELDDRRQWQIEVEEVVGEKEAQ